MSVDSQQLNDELSGALSDCQVSVEGDGGKFLVTVIGDVFAGLNPVKRQQLVYQHLNPHIQSGAVHAVSMQLHTPEEAAQKS